MKRATLCAALLLIPPTVHAQTVDADTAVTRTVEARGMTPLEIFFDALNVGVLAITGFIVWRYTIHTYKLRKAAERQTNLIQAQIEQMEKNYQQYVKQLNFEVQKATREVRPKFVVKNTLFSRSENSERVLDRYTLVVENRGGEIREIEAVPEGGFDVKIDSPIAIRSGATAWIHVEGPIKDEVMRPNYFVLRFTNELNTRTQLRYWTAPGELVEVPIAGVHNDG